MLQKYNSSDRNSIYLIVYSDPLIMPLPTFQRLFLSWLNSKRQVEACSSVVTMVVVSSLGPPEQGVRLTVENCAVFINRKQLGSKVTVV